MIYIYDTYTGEILQSFRGAKRSEFPDEIIAPGTALIESEADVNDTTHFVANDEIVAFPLKPSMYHKWDWTSKTWIPDLSAVISARKAEIDRERERRNQLPIAYAGSIFDADAIAMRNISGWQTQIAAGATLPLDFVWRDYDNIDHPADADFVNGLGAAITTRGTRLYAASWAHKAAIKSLKTVEEVIAYDLAQGWPE